MIIKSNDLEWEKIDRGEKSFRYKRLAKPTNSEDIATSIVEIFPNSKSWPYHYHLGNEESAYIVEGKGEVRGKDETKRIKEGDYLSFKKGRKGVHQFQNPFDKKLRLLINSTMKAPDVIVYPDSEKIGIMDSAPGSKKYGLRKFFKKNDEVDYW